MTKSKLMKGVTHVILVLLFSLNYFSTQAQESNKIDLLTRRMLHAKGFKRTNINLFVRGDEKGVQQATEKAGGRFKYNYGDICAVNIPIKYLDQFANDNSVLFIENGDIPLVKMNDSAIITNTVLPVQNGQSPLTQPYKGDGVIMGIIDDGIDIFHKDFRKADGKTRIRYLWSQIAANTNSPLPYGYGQEWSEADINSGNCNYYPQTNTFSHGTHVSGTACGNGLAANAFIGMAPNTDIIEVEVNEGNGFLSDFVDAVDYIFKKADAMGKPCVINASVGTYFGSRDGKDLQAEAIDRMLDARKGRSLVCALGNAGQIKMHLGYTVTRDTAFTWFQTNPSTNDVYFEAWADTSNLDSVYFSIGADDVAGHTYIGNLGFKNIKTDYQVGPTNTSQFNVYAFYSGTTFVATCSTQVVYDQGRYRLAIEVLPQNSSYNWRFITTGKGKFDLWSARKQMGYYFADMVYVAPDTNLNPSYKNYRSPDTLQTLVSSFTCSDKVISVGNFVNRTSYIDVNGDTVLYSDMTTGSLFKDDNADTTVRLGSSYGPTRDGRLKPDISAPGGIVLSAGDSVFIQNARNSGNPANIRKIAYTGKHYRNSGTSMASPMVAGAVALYLQKNPNASYREIKEAFISTARKDSFTGPTANIAYGNGKLDCFQAMLTNIHFGCTDTAALNFDSTANHNDGSCIAKVYGCMNVDADNYNALANVPDTCIFSKLGINPIKKNDPTVAIYPNPSNGNAVIYYYINSDMVGSTHVIITDLLGRLVSDIKLTDTQGTINYVQTTKGIYLYHLQNGDKSFANKKLIIY